MPDRAAGGVGVGVGARVLVGVGVGVGPVGVGVAVAVLVAGVDTTVGVQVGVLSVDATTVAPGTGMMSTWPGRISVGSAMSFALARAATVTSKRRAISNSVSPRWTT